MFQTQQQNSKISLIRTRQTVENWDHLFHAEICPIPERLSDEKPFKHILGSLDSDLREFTFAVHVFVQQMCVMIIFNKLPIIYNGYLTSIRFW